MLITYFVTLNTLLVLGLNAYVYGLWNLCFFCDISLLLTMMTFYIPHKFRSEISSLATLLAFLPCIAWTLDYLLLYFNICIFGLANYMFDAKYHIGMRFLSTFHIWLWIVHIYLLKKYKYNKNSFVNWLVFITIIYLILNIFTPEYPDNINSYKNPIYTCIFIVFNFIIHKLFLKYFCYF